MSRAELIYPFKERIERELARIESDPYNKESLIRYYKVRSPLLALATVRNELNRLYHISRLLNKKFEEATVQDMENLVFEFTKRCKHQNTLARYCKLLKRFHQWLKGCAYDEYPPEVKWIRVKRGPMCTLTEDDLVSYDECIKITEHSLNLRDKALFQCKLDAGCRIGEILTPKIREVTFNDFGAIIQSDGKTGKAPLILTWSAKTLAMWLNIHPFRDNPDAPLWPLLERNEPVQLSYAAAYSAFKKCVKRSSCKKRVWPHLFKHVSCSMDSEIGLSDTYRKFKHHWTPSSRMPQVYEHLSKSIIPRIQMETLQKQTGQTMQIADKEPENKVQVFKKCNRCEFENPRDSKYCNRCSYPMDNTGEEMAKKMIVEKMLYDIVSSPEKLEKLRTFFSETYKN